MNIEVVRPQVCGQTCTIGEMLINGERKCFTLEDVVRPDGEKVYGETAIPTGRYRVDITFSNRFQRDMPLLLSVPNFEGIRIHPGNTAVDTYGCILVGMDRSGDSILNSRVAYALVFADIRDALDRGEEVWCEVR